MPIMRAGRRFASLLGLMLVLAISLTGCLHEDRAVTFNGDGSGTYALAIGITDQLMSLGGDQINQSMDKCVQTAKQQGATVAKDDVSGYTTWHFTFHFANVAAVNTLLAGQFLSTCGSTSSDTGAGTPTTAPSPNDTFNVTRQSGVFSTTFHVTGHMSLVLPSQPTDTGGVDTSQLFKDMHDSISITMPGWITSHTGGTVSGNTITYTIHYGEQADIDVTGGGRTAAATAAIAGGIALILLGVAALIFVLLMRRRRARAQASAMVAVPYTPITSSTPASYPPPVPPARYAGEQTLPGASGATNTWPQPPSAPTPNE
jgi:hypothetical protein